MVALLDDAAGVHHQDGVGVADGRQPVGDHEAGAVRAQRRHGLLDEHLGAGVDRAGGLVEDEDRRVGQERPGDGEQLLLAGADVAALVVDDRVVAVGQRVHEAVDVGGRAAAMDLLLGGVEVAVGDVVADGAAEQPGVLQHHAHVRAQVAAPHLGDVVAVEA